MSKRERVMVKDFVMPFTNLLGYDSVRWDHIMGLIKRNIKTNINELVESSLLQIYYNSDKKEVIIIPSTNQLSYRERIKKDFELIFTMEKVRDTNNEIEYLFKLEKEDFFKGSFGIDFYYKIIIRLNRLNKEEEMKEEAVVKNKKCYIVRENSNIWGVFTRESDAKSLAEKVANDRLSASLNYVNPAFGGTIPNEPLDGTMRENDLNGRPMHIPGYGLPSYGNGMVINLRIEIWEGDKLLKELKPKITF